MRPGVHAARAFQKVRLKPVIDSVSRPSPSALCRIHTSTPSRPLPCHLLPTASSKTPDTPTCTPPAPRISQSSVSPPSFAHTCSPSAHWSQLYVYQTLCNNNLLRCQLVMTSACKFHSELCLSFLSFCLIEPTLGFELWIVCHLHFCLQ